MIQAILIGMCYAFGFWLVCLPALMACVSLLRMFPAEDKYKEERDHVNSLIAERNAIGHEQVSVLNSISNGIEFVNESINRK